ncbi:Tyrosine recombinase XerA [uncultured archaeon]|nr:Tyrosine recombinase XerA [uncultured archaeon]
MKNTRRILTQAELTAMRGKCSNALEQAIFETLRSCGCRVDELVHVLREDINLEGNQVHIRKPKKVVTWTNRRTGEYESVSNPRDSILDEAAVVALRVYLKTKDFKPGSRVFPRTTRAIHGMVKRWASDAKVQRPEEIHPHTFRHTCGTMLLAQGVPEPYILQILGWSKSSRTFRETYNDPPMDIVKDRVLKARKEASESTKKPG